MNQSPQDLLRRLGIERPAALWIDGRSQSCSGERLTVRSPVNGDTLAEFAAATASDVRTAIGQAHDAFLQWRMVPPPVRGELVRRFGETLRNHKADLAELVSWEVGKIRQEALGEVQEMIDI